LYLTEGNTALRGNEGSGKNKSNSEGNFIRTVKLMSEFDPILYELLTFDEVDGDRRLTITTENFKIKVFFFPL